MPNRVEALRNRVALYRSYLRVGARGDLAIEYMRQIADDLDAIREAQARKFSGQALGSEASPAAAEANR
jgi:hypothetical protein